ncbi:hypothetical protein LAUMK13_02987 [Mycobacterium innocens]|uniref:Uncharacterized protein n=1 Tax=Mycobacterium innocens TaxID=2341083 RepID=A0A498Q915_9MYCO|nr:hypothetical protein LAUMK13_02987 [Mycobacterium innocens]
MAAWIVPSDNDCAPAAAGSPVIIPVANDWLRDCGDKGAAAAAKGPPVAVGAEMPGVEGPPTTIAGVPGGNGGATVPTGGGPAGTLPTPNAASDADAAPRPPGGGASGTLPTPNATGDSGDTPSLPAGDCAPGTLPLPKAACASGDGESKSSAVIGRDGGGLSRFTPCSRSHLRASPPMVASSTRCVASTMLDIAFAPAWDALAFFSTITAFTAATLASVDPLPDRIRSISALPDSAISLSRSRKWLTASATRSLCSLFTWH